MEKSYNTINENPDSQSNSSDEEPKWEIFKTLYCQNRFLNFTDKNQKTSKTLDVIEKTPGDDEFDLNTSKILLISEWQLTYNWVEYKLEKEHLVIFCKICNELNKTKKSGFSTGSQNLQLSAIKDHSISKSHKENLDLYIKKSQTTLTGEREKYNEFIPEKLKNLFSNVLFVAFYNLPISKAKHLHDLSDFHQVDITKEYRSDYYTKEVLSCLNYSISNQLLEKLKNLKFVGLMIDESTDLSSEKLLMVYIRYLDTEHWKPKESYLKLLELHELKGENIFQVLECYLKEIKLIDKVVSINTDGARVMTSLQRGVVGLFSKNYPYLIAGHFAAHKLNLVTSTIVSEFNEIEEVIHFIYNIDSYFRNSYLYSKILSENQHELLDKKLRMIRPLKIRWLSYHNATKRFILLLPAIIQTLTEISDKDDKAKGFLKNLRKYNFLGQIYILNDILGILSGSNQILQKSCLSYTELCETIAEDLQIIESRYLGEAPEYGESQKVFLNLTRNTDEISFKLKNNKIVKLTLKRTPGDEIKLCDSSIIIAQKVFHNLNSRFSKNDLLEAIDILNIERLKKDFKRKILCNKEYGSIHIDFLLKHFISFKWISEEVIYQWEKFRNSFFPGVVNLENEKILEILFIEKVHSYDQIIRLYEIYYSITLTTVEVERGFSKMNTIKTKLRNTLLTNNLDALMNIKLNSNKNIEEFDFQAAYDYWQQLRPRKIILTSFKH